MNILLVLYSMGTWVKRHIIRRRRIGNFPGHWLRVSFSGQYESFADFSHTDTAISTSYNLCWGNEDHYHIAPYSPAIITDREQKSRPKGLPRACSLLATR